MAKVPGPQAGPGPPHHTSSVLAERPFGRPYCGEPGCPLRNTALRKGTREHRRGLCVQDTVLHIVVQASFLTRNGPIYQGQNSCGVHIFRFRPREAQMAFLSPGCSASGSNLGKEYLIAPSIPDRILDSVA